MNERIEVIYPSDDEIREQVNFIVNHSPSKKRTVIDHVYEYCQSLYISKFHLIVNHSSSKKRTIIDHVYEYFDIRYIFQNYLEVIAFGLVLIFTLLTPSAPSG